MKSKQIFLLGLFFCLFTACNPNFETFSNDVPTENVITVNTKHLINEAEAILGATNFMTESIMQTKKTKANMQINVETIYRPIDVATNSLTKAAEVEYIPIYIIRFSNKEDNKPRGFVVKVGDDRVSNGILSFSEDGIWDLSGIPEFEQFFLAQTDTYITEKIKDYSNMFSDDVDPCDTGFIQEVIASDDKRCNLNITWHQSPSPYYDNLPFCTGDTHSPAGCVAIAIAQIMSYHQKPLGGSYVHPVTKQTVTTSYNWSGMKFATSATNLTNAVYRKQVSDLIAEIGYKVEMNYGCNSSGANSGVAPACFVEMGYKSANSIQQYQVEDVIKEIRSNYPVYISGRSRDGENGHAWVIEGYKSESWVEKQIRYCPNRPDEETFTGNTGNNYYLYFNLGWGGYSNGYYFVSETSLYPDGAFQFYTNARIITNIRPN